MFIRHRSKRHVTRGKTKKNQLKTIICQLINHRNKKHGHDVGQYEEQWKWYTTTTMISKSVNLLLDELISPTCESLCVTHKLVIFCREIPQKTECTLLAESYF